MGRLAEIYQQLFHTIFRLYENYGYPTYWSYIYKRGFYTALIDIDRA